MLYANDLSVVSFVFILVLTQGVSDGGISRCETSSELAAHLKSCVQTGCPLLLPSFIQWRTELGAIF